MICTLQSVRGTFIENGRVPFGGFRCKDCGEKAIVQHKASEGRKRGIFIMPFRCHPGADRVAWERPMINAYNKVTALIDDGVYVPDWLESDEAMEWVAEGKDWGDKRVDVGIGDLAMAHAWAKLWGYKPQPKVDITPDEEASNALFDRICSRDPNPSALTGWGGYGPSPAKAARRS